MPNTKQDKTLSVDELAAEWFKDPEFVREYEALEEEFAELERQIDRRRARRLRREALVARVREGVQSLVAGMRDFWHWLVPGRDRVAY